MCDLRLEIGGQVDDINGPKRALLYTDTTSYTKTLGDESNLGLWSNLDAELAGAYDRA